MSTDDKDNNNGGNVGGAFQPPTRNPPTVTFGT